MQNFCPRIAKVTVHGETKGQYRTTKPTIAHHTITTARRPDNIHSSALVWADPPSSWPAHVAGNKGDSPKRGYISAILLGSAGFYQVRSTPTHTLAMTHVHGLLAPTVLPARARVPKVIGREIRLRHEEGGTKK